MADPGRPVVPEAQRRKRAVYAGLLLVALLSTLVSLVANVSAPQVDPIAVGIGIAALALFALIGVAFTRHWLSIERIEQSVFAVAALVLLGSLVVRLYLGHAPHGADLAVITTVLWFPIMFLVSAIAFSTRVSLRVSGALLVAFLLTTLPNAIGLGGTVVARFDAGFWLQVYLVYGVAIISLYFFGGLQQRADAMEDAARSMRQLALTDMLTGLPNRRQGEERLRAELQRAERYGRVFSVLMVDIDHFKALNDRFGHQSGDDVLVDLARYLGSMLRVSDTVARWGGEEFLVVAPETDRADAERLAELMRVSVERHTLVARFNVTISLGIATYRSGDTKNDLIARADAALYRAKRAGRNRIASEERPQPGAD